MCLEIGGDLVAVQVQTPAGMTLLSLLQSLCHAVR